MEGKKIAKRGAAVTGVAAVAALAILLGTGKLGFGSGVGLGDPAAPSNKEEAAVVTTVDSAPESTPETAQPEKNEIRIQGRTYNYRNVSYGNGEHTLEELMAELDKLPRDARIELIIEDDATKNAVDDLERALSEAGFSDVHK